jgi:hypothetical protein
MRASGILFAFSPLLRAYAEYLRSIGSDNPETDDLRSYVLQHARWFRKLVLEQQDELRTKREETARAILDQTSSSAREAIYLLSQSSPEAKARIWQNARLRSWTSEFATLEAWLHVVTRYLLSDSLQIVRGHLEFFCGTELQDLIGDLGCCILAIRKRKENATLTEELVNRSIAALLPIIEDIRTGRLQVANIVAEKAEIAADEEPFCNKVEEWENAGSWTPEDDLEDEIDDHGRLLGDGEFVDQDDREIARTLLTDLKNLRDDLTEYFLNLE